MQIKNTVALALAAIFMAVSCITVDKKVGEDLIPDNQEIPVFMAEFDIPVQLKSPQPIQTASENVSTFGSIRTEEFGLVEFATVADVYPSASGWDFGTDAVVKEVYLLGNVSQLFVTEDDQLGIPQQVFVHRTYKNVDTTTVFNNSFTEADYDPVPLNAGEAMYFGSDSLKVYLNTAYAQELLTATQDERDTLRLFAERFKGLLIKTNTPDEGTVGGRENFLNFGLSAIYIRINFQPTWKEGLSRKDTIFTLNYGKDQCVNISRHDSYNMQNATPGDILAIEGAAGLKPYIDKDELKQCIEQWKAANGLTGKDIVIAKGTLVFPFEIPQDNNMNKYPTSLYPCTKQYDSTRRANVFLPSTDVTNEGYSVGALNRSLCEYRMDIPTIIQDFVSKDVSELTDLEHNIWMLPIETTTDSYYGTTGFTINSTSYAVGHINGPGNKRAPKLQIVYSVLQ